MDMLHDIIGKLYAQKHERHESNVALTALKMGIIKVFDIYSFCHLHFINIRYLGVYFI